jgi:hypothetical protein
MPKEYLPINEKQWEESGSKFVTKAGRYIATMQMPKWKSAGKSYEFPFVISEEGLEKGKMASDYPGMVKFSLEPWFISCGVKFEFENGKLAFDKGDFVNKKFFAVFTDQPDERPLDKGGTGKTFVKFDHPEPISKESQELI